MSDSNADGEQEIFAVAMSAYQQTWFQIKGPS
jgi:hypothetical protein